MTNANKRQFNFLATLIAFSMLILSPGISSAAMKVGVVLDKGGKDDRSFNAAAFKGATEAEKEFKLFLKVVETKDDNEYVPLLKSFAKKDFNLVIAIGIQQADALKKVAAEFPKTHFAIVDAEIDLPNVKSLLFEEHEGSFLVGVMAATKGKTDSVGFIGGMDIPLIRRFQMGYEAGVKHVDAKKKVISNYVGVTGDAWNNPAKGKELALSQYTRGADVVFAAAGKSGEGLFDAAEEAKKLAIGVDSNQNWIKPGRVLTSMLKRVDTAVYETCKEVVNGKFTAGIIRFGLKNGGIDYALDENNKSLFTADELKKIDGIKADIIAGKIKVPDYYLTTKK